VSIAAAADGSSISNHITIAPEGHLELVEDADEVVGEPRDATTMSIDEILEEVEAYGRGKRRQIKSRRYEDDFEGH
jgi:hypothetical protein